jgi:hypothetical protein
MVNTGGGPDRDDTGLPPVDVEIPDDARELDRDVQAYRREQRAERRRRRSRRLHLTLGREGMVMPLLICCLVFALISGTLLTLFTATSIDQTGLPGDKAGPGSAGEQTTTPTPAPAQLDAATVGVGGQPEALRLLGPAILLVIPANCGCYPVVTDVARLASARHEYIYLVATDSGYASAQRLVSRLGHGLQPVTDETGALASQSEYLHTGLTAIAVTFSGMVSYEDHLQAGPDLTTLVDSV